MVEELTRRFDAEADEFTYLFMLLIWVDPVDAGRAERSEIGSRLKPLRCSHRWPEIAPFGGNRTTPDCNNCRKLEAGVSDQRFGSLDEVIALL